MKKLSSLLIAAALIAAPIGAIHAADAKDPIVQKRNEVHAATKESDAEIAVAKKEYKAVVSEAKAELKKAKAENAVKAKDAASGGKDPLVVQRELDAKSKADYDAKVKEAKAKYNEAKKASKATLSKEKAAANEKMGTVPPTKDAQK